MSCALVQVYMQIFAGGWLKQTSSGRACHINVLKLQAGLHHNPATKACCLQLSHLASGPMLYFDPQNGVTLCPQLHAHTHDCPLRRFKVTLRLTSSLAIYVQYTN